jgi:hypothetical protein
MRYLLILAVFLFGCATPEQRAQQVIDAFGPYCEKLGFTPNTDPWRQCLQAEDMKNAIALHHAHELAFRHGLHCIHSWRSRWC